jgi:hypothetical protein
MKPRLFLLALLAASLANAQPAAPENPAVAPDNLDTLAQQAPNAVAWVLAPLDAAVAPDIRQNLTYLREALLDEAAKKPAAIPDAYKIGEQVCDAMIGALDERDRTRARAGFRAVEARTRTGVSSEALDARRTSSPGKRMTWPVFDREQAQRDELKNQAVNKAAVIAERPKLEWSQRADQIRPALDALYKQFREALRKSPGRNVATIAPVVASVSPVVQPVPQSPPDPKTETPSPRAAGPDTGHSEQFFVEKSWYSRVGSEYHFNKGGTGFRLPRGVANSDPITWKHLPDGLIEVMQRMNPTAQPSPTYFRFVDANTAFIGNTKANVTTPVTPTKK